MLQKVTIRGFKSFPDSVELALEGGIVAIVGPNGCGKSNIADSISWALGEQSPNSLRGKKMEQMIFSGSSSRKPMGLAEVTIALAPNGQLPELTRIRDGEGGLVRQGSNLATLLGEGDGVVMVTRRMFRDAQSEYLLNGKPCRLRDIQDLLMNLGVGTRSITLMEQDRINAILSSRPADRRVIIEDAAGITKFKLNKHLTNLKLERSEANLLRINDLLQEQEVHLRRLRSQAGRASRYKRLTEEARRIEKTILAVRHSELKRQKGESASKLSRLEEEIAEAGAVLAAAESAESQLRQQADELSYALGKIRDRLYRSNLELDRDTNRLKHLREGLDDLYRRSEEAGARLQENETRLRDRRQRLEKIAGESGELEQQRRRLEAHLATLRQRADGADSEFDSLKRETGAVQGDLAAKRELLAAEKTRQEWLKAEERRLAGAVASVSAQREKALASVSEQEDEIAQLVLRLEGIDEALLERERETARVGRQIKAAEGELAARESRAESLRSAISGAEATRATLREMEEQREGHAEATRAVFENEGIAARVAPLGLVADRLRIDSEHAKAVISAYGHLLEAIIVSDEQAAESGIHMLREADIGQAAFVPLSNLPEGKLAPPPRGDLRTFISCADGEADRLLHLFPAARLAGDIHEALVLSANGQASLAATPDGAVAMGGRVLRGGADSDRERVFTRRSRIEEIGRECGSLARELDSLLESKRKNQACIEELLAEEKAINTAREKLRMEKAELQAGLLSARKEKDRREGEAAERSSEAQSLTDQLRRCRDERAAAMRRTEELGDSVEQLNAELDAAQARLEAAADKVNEVKRSEHELSAEAGALRERIRSAATAAAALERDVAELENSLESARRDLHAIEDQRVTNLREIGEIEAGTEAKLEHNSQLSKELATLEEQLGGLQVKLRARIEETKAARTKHREIQERLEEVRLVDRERLLDLKHLQQQAGETLKLNPEDLEEMAVEEPELDVEEATRSLERIRDSLEKMGPVNLLAAEEYEEQAERFNFLSTQRNDLVESIASLRQVITRIDKISRERFAEAFEKINENFHTVFRRLFGGGRAELRMEEGDLLEAGLDIIVQPPGKRPQSATLLSGGEKSLAAFSMILAVLQYRPSPFCILDEADAALDEPNTRRIATLLREYSDRTQFILITHNKTTMEIADRLYGVTMEEPGVSKLVSVKFN